MTPTETYLFYGSIASGVLAVLLFIGYFFTTSDTVLSRGTMALFILFLLGSLGSAGVYYYERKQDASTYTNPKHVDHDHVTIDRNPWIIPLKGCIHA